MNSLAITNQVLDHIVQEGKNMLLDKKINKEKVPVFVNSKINNVNFDSMVHGGYQHEYRSCKNSRSMQKQLQPQNIKRDRWGHTKSRIDKSKVSRNSSKSPQGGKKHRSFSHSGFKKIKSNGFDGLQLQSNIKQKQNRFVKLQQDNGGKIVIQRVKLKQQGEEDQWRQSKKKALMDQYQQKIATEIFYRQRQESKQAKQKKLMAHTNRGKEHSFYFHEGEAILCHQDEQPYKINYPKQTNFNIQADQFQEAQKEEKKLTERSSQIFKKTKQKSINQNQLVNQHHRIKSARGQVFASAVLKTINLSRISLNQTLRNLQIEQFMKRNDLFNNNHSRQTSSIPYLNPKSGTVYTELSTNQVIGDGKAQSQDKQSYTFRSQITKKHQSLRKKSHFQPHYANEHENKNKTERIFNQRNNFEEEYDSKIETRPIRTADGPRRRAYMSERRPRTSSTRGRITTANQDLAAVLLQ